MSRWANEGIRLSVYQYVDIRAAGDTEIGGCLPDEGSVYWMKAI